MQLDPDTQLAILRAYWVGRPAEYTPKDAFATTPAITYRGVCTEVTEPGILDYDGIAWPEWKKNPWFTGKIEFVKPNGDKSWVRVNIAYFEEVPDAAP